MLGGTAARTSPWVALCMVASVDGSVTLHDVSGGLGGPADKVALARVRDACDVLLVGAGTVRDERYPPYPGGADRQARRVAKGLAPRPPVALVTRGGELALGHPLVADPERPPLVIVAASDAPAARTRLTSTPAGPGIEWIVAGDETIDWPTALTALAARGLPRISCEGGPRLNAALLEADCVDEVFVTIAPAFVGGQGLRLTHGTLPPERRELRLISTLVHGDEVLLRYHRTSVDTRP